MSVTRHPNIHAVGFTADIFMAYLHRLRGPARKVMGARVNEIISKRVADFVIEISTALDNEFGTGDDVYELSPDEVRIMDDLKKLHDEGKV